MDPDQRRAAMVEIAHSERHDLFSLPGRGVGESEDPELSEASGEIGLGDLSKLGCKGHYYPRRNTGG
jgi:hypothetical protein